MNHTVISITSIFVFAFLVSFASSLEFQLISPSSSNVNTSFSVSISSSVSDVYDVKLFVHDDSKEFCEIYYDGKWNNPFYYLKGVFPQTTEYKVRAYYSGTTKICARLRKTNSSSFTEVCNPITINPQTNQPAQASKTNDSSSNKTSFDKSKNQHNTATNDFIPRTEMQELQEQENLSIAYNDKIFLNNKKEDIRFIAKQEKIKIYAFYLFVILLVFIIIYLFVRNL